MENDEPKNFMEFKKQEQEGWEKRANSYDFHSSPATSQAVNALLDAVGARSGMQLLDVATGTGLVAGKAASRGIDAWGIDFAPSMISVAKRNYPEAQFDVGDAEVLSFEDASFDAVICQFGINHMADPDAAISEIYRILRSSAKFAFTVWGALEKDEVRKIVKEAVQTYGSLEISMPPAPPLLRFSDHDECKRVLKAFGFINIRVLEIPIVTERTPQGLLDLLYNGTVRNAMLLEAQTEDARNKINEAIIEGAQKLEPAGNGKVRIRRTAVLASAQKLK